MPGVLQHYGSTAFELVSINNIVFFITGVSKELRTWLRAGLFTDVVLWDLPCRSPVMVVELSVVQTPFFPGTRVIYGDGLVFFDSGERQELLGLGFSW